MANEKNLDGGWLKLHRSVTNSWVWKEKPFSYGQAWVDMIIRANHEDNKMLFNHQFVTIERGSFVCSLRKLASDWGWSPNKLRRFCQLLKSDEMVLINGITDGHGKGSTRGTLVTIVNYGFYQLQQHSDEYTSEHTNEHGGETTDGTETEQRRNTNKNLRTKELKKDIESTNVLPCQLVVDLFNEICKSYPKVTTLSERRKKAISARAKTVNQDIGKFKQVFEIAEASDFLKGKNSRDWSANFDWLMCDSNFTKVLDGNYSKKGAVRNDSFEQSYRRKLNELADSIEIDENGSLF